MAQPAPEPGKGAPPPGYTPVAQPGGYPAQQPPPQPMAGGPPPVAQTVIVTQPVMRFGEAPAVCQCQFCGAQVTTTTNYSNGLLTWLAVGGLCLFGCWLGCCLIPLCVDACKDVEHTCPNCNRLLGKYERIKF